MVSLDNNELNYHCVIFFLVLGLTHPGLLGSDAIWQCRLGSTLAQVMACYLVAPMWAGPLIYYSGGCLNNPIFFNFGLCAACWAHFMCHHELWPTSVSHPFYFLNSSLGLARRKYYQKIIILIFRLVLQNFAIPGNFLYILFYHYLFSGWFVIAICGSISVRELVKS